MDAEALAALDRLLDGAVQNPGWVNLDVVRNLRAHIDALQAENERLRSEAINARRARVASLREQNQGLQARVTELEGLLYRSRAEADECVRAGNSSKHDLTLCDETNAALRPVDAALSRSTEDKP